MPPPPRISVLAADGGRANSLIGEEIRPIRAVIRARCHVQQLPASTIRLHPPGETTMPDVRRRAGSFPVGGIDDYGPRSGSEKVPHIDLEDRILGQVGNDVE